MRAWHNVTLFRFSTHKFRPEFINPAGIGVALYGGMHTSTSSTTSIPLPPSSLDPDDGRVLLFQLDDPETGEGWRMFSLVDRSYLFEMQTANGVLISERHASFAGVSARADRWYDERVIEEVA